MDVEDWDLRYERERGRSTSAAAAASTSNALAPAPPPQAARRSATANRGTSALGDGDRDVAMPVDDPDVDVEQPDRRMELFVEDEPAGTPLELLTMHWMNERNCPDILPAQEELLTKLLDHLRRQSDAVQLLRSDPSTSEEEHLRIMLVQTEVERVKFIVRSYVRTRLYKIEKYARFITTNGEIQTRLTAAEREHASRHANLTDQHFWLSVLQSLPEKQSHLDDTPLFVPPMVTQPEKTRPVFAHALKDCPHIQLAGRGAIDMAKGHISLLPYDAIEHLVLRGEMELI